jgi:O-antigen ligase
MRTRDQISLYASGVVLLTAVTLVGGAPRWALATSLLACALAVAATVTSRRRLSMAPPLLVALVTAIGVTLLQIVPLPSGIIHHLNPRSAALREEGLAMIGQYADWQTISMDSAGTVRGAALLLLMLGAGYVALRFAASERGRFWLSAGISVVCVLCALITGAHAMLGAKSLYALYAPKESLTALVGPLLNSNHFGSLMGVGTLVSAGLVAFDREAVTRRLGWICATLICIAATMLSLSRGAVISLGLGIMTFGIVMLAQRYGVNKDRRSKDEMWRTKVPMAVFATCVVGLVVYSSAERVAGQLIDTRLTEIGEKHSKFAAWRSGAEMFAEAPWFGVGRGATEPVFTRIHAASSYHTFSHLENEYLQGLVEWGLVGSILIAIPLLWLGLHMLQRWNRGPLAAGAMAALAALMAQSAVDFGISLPALAVVAVVLCAILSYVPISETRASSKDGSRTATSGTWTGLKTNQRRALLLRSALVSGLLVAAALVLLPSSRTIAEQHDDLTKSSPDIATAKRAISQQPLDYFGYAAASEALLRNKDVGAAEFLRHALVLHPTHAGLHRLTASLLLQGGRLEQAALEYRLALQNSNNRRRLLEEIAVRFPDMDTALKAIPVDLPMPEQVARSLSDDGHPALAMKWIESVMALPRANTTGLNAMFAVLAQQSGEVAEIEKAARLQHAEKKSLATMLALARILSGQAKFAEAAEVLTDVATTAGRIDDVGRGWNMRCDALVGAKKIDDARDCLRRLITSGLLNVDQVRSTSNRLSLIDRQAPTESGSASQ